MKNLIYCVSLVLFLSCSKPYKITVTNRTDFPVSEVIEIDMNLINWRDVAVNENVQVKDEEGARFPSQLMDTDANGIADQLLVQVSVLPKSSMRLQLSVGDTSLIEEPEIRTYCRFVPERMDDFAWENDKVAFRVYGSECQRLFEQGNPEGLISSGIDCWLKRVDYPILDKWYAKEKSGGSYHEDDGEGLDNFHVGTSRGCGGTSIRHKGEFIYTENYVEWGILANGPLRSVFWLKYPPVMVDGTYVTETKTFSIDLGDNFYRCDVEFEGEVSIDTLAIGLTLHDNLGSTDCSDDGWISYWEPIGDSEIGLGAWVEQEWMLGYEKTENAGTDQNHIWLFAALRANKLTYWSGFGWKKAGKFSDEDLWKKYIKEQKAILENPLVITFEGDK